MVDTISALYHASEHQHRTLTINRGLDVLEADTRLQCHRSGLARSTWRAPLAYLDFREVVDWRGSHPKLVAWLDEFAAAIPAFGEIKPPPA